MSRPLISLRAGRSRAPEGIEDLFTEDFVLHVSGADFPGGHRIVPRLAIEWPPNALRAPNSHLFMIDTAGVFAPSVGPLESPPLRGPVTTAWPAVFRRGFGQTRPRAHLRAGLACQSRWRAVNAPYLVVLVRAGARFHGGVLVEREEAPQL